MDLNFLQKALLAEMFKTEGFSLIGELIKPSDNSYCTCVDSGCQAHVAGKRFVCMSEPYTKTVHSSWDKDITYERDMIKILSLRSGRMYEVMFNESDLIKD